MKCREAEEGSSLDLCFCQPDSFLLLSVRAGLFQGEGQDVEVLAELLDLEKHQTIFRFKILKLWDWKSLFMVFKFESISSSFYVQIL